MNKDWIAYLGIFIFLMGAIASGTVFLFIGIIMVVGWYAFQPDKGENWPKTKKVEPQEPNRQKVDTPYVPPKARGNMFMPAKEKKEYLQSKSFKNKRRVVFFRAGNKCQHCGSVKNLQCHHITYQRLGDELLEDLACLCGDRMENDNFIEGCHNKLHNAIGITLKRKYDRQAIYSLKWLK